MNMVEAVMSWWTIAILAGTARASKMKEWGLFVS
jgi:hypothetical protein